MPTTFDRTRTNHHVVCTELTVTHCGECHVHFAMPSTLERDARAHPGWDNPKGVSFHCPFGHELRYRGTDETERLRGDLAATRAQLDQSRATARHLELRVRALKGVVTKARRRHAVGLCPVPSCRRTFQNLARHMATKHPRFEPTVEDLA